MIGRRALLGSAVVGAASVALAACTSQGGPAQVTFRLWDEQAATAYRSSFAALERRHPGIRVQVVVVPWASYFERLRLDLAAGRGPDVFWTNAANFVAYARAGRLIDVDGVLGRSARGRFVPQVVAQYTDRGTLWGVPQLTDPGIGLVVNRSLLTDAGMTDADVAALSWDPSAPDDPLRRAARRLTIDAAGRHPGDGRFETATTRQYGYSASNDLNAMLLEFLGSNGAAWQQGDRFVFDSPKGREALRYLVDLVTRDRVAPPAAQTNPPNGGDAALALFLRGRIALLQTGAYNLAAIEQQATFPWSVAPLPKGPAGAISVTNGVIAAGDARSASQEATRIVLDWLASADGVRALGTTGDALPAVIAAQPGYHAYWTARKVDIAPMLDVLGNGTIQAPQGARYAAAQDALQPILDDVFLGRRPVESGLAAAQRAANAAISAS